MPVTAKLSRRFYEALGDDVANELVEWFNQVDLTYRTDLKDLNELNFSRFDAKVEQRFAQFEQRFARFETVVDRRFADFEVHLEKRFAELEVRWEKRLTELEGRWERRFADFEGRWERELVALKAEVLAGQLGQTRWMIGLWLTTALAVLGLYLR